MIILCDHGLLRQIDLASLACVFCAVSFLAVGAFNCIAPFSTVNCGENSDTLEISDRIVVSKNGQNTFVLAFHLLLL